MPTYDYRCERCHEQFELWQSFSDDTLVKCPVEGGPAACEAPGHGSVKKVFSKVGIAFKGDGFYTNDHGAIATGRAEESTSSSKSEKSSDSKSNDSSSNGTSKGSSGSESSDPGSSKNKSSDSKSVSTTSTAD